jgi:peptidoglycan/xylan/chitin deacetylase (PgdA/CDA1 family)
MPQSATAGVELASFGYHDVTDEPSDSGFQRPSALIYKLGHRAFEAHLDSFQASGLAPELVTDIDLTGAGRHLLLTFDDGGKSALRTGGALAARGWRGHFFVITSLLGDRHFLTADEARSLRDAGHVIGSHSDTHPTPFRALPAARMVEEWRVSCDRIAQVLGEPCTIASVPGGDISDATLRSAAEAGLTHLFTSEPWRTPRRTAGCWVLGRYMPKVSTTPLRVQALAQGRGWARALLLRRATVLAKRVLPLPYRLYLRRNRDGQSPGAH